MKKKGPNKVVGVLGVIANFGLARLAPESSIRRLVRALDSANEDTSTAAYMALVKLGRRYSRVVLQSCPQPSSSVVQVLGDMGDVSVIPELEQLAHSGELAEVARESIEALRDCAGEP